jgi:hypothetical protein
MNDQKNGSGLMSRSRSTRSVAGVTPGGLGLWFALPLGLAFFLFVISSFAETNRLPFDLPEAEAELVAGYHAEYSSMKFSLFMMGEYAHLITASALMATLFFGGWDIPFWAERLREVRFDFTDEQLRPYFSLERVLDGLFHLGHRLFGITAVRADGEAPVWHKDVRFFKVFDENGRRVLDDTARRAPDCREGVTASWGVKGAHLVSHVDKVERFCVPYFSSGQESTYLDTSSPLARHGIPLFRQGVQR